MWFIVFLILEAFLKHLDGYSTPLNLSATFHFLFNQPMQSGIMTSISSRLHIAISDRPLPIVKYKYEI